LSKILFDSEVKAPYFVAAARIHLTFTEFVLAENTFDKLITADAGGSADFALSFSAAITSPPPCRVSRHTASSISPRSTALRAPTTVAKELHRRGLSLSSIMVIHHIAPQFDKNVQLY
jgi:hypothetical protein